MRKVCFISLIFFLTGCMTTQSSSLKSSKKGIMDAYLTKIQKYDGINQEEAVLLAQSQLIFRGLDSKYYLDKPEVLFEDERDWQIRFNPINKTFAEVTASHPMIILVNKKDGRVMAP